MSVNRKYDIFISYRHENTAVIYELVHRLERYYDVFWDQRLESGYWSKQLENAIDNSTVVLVNFSRDSLIKRNGDEDWFYREIKYSMEHKSSEAIIPVFHEGFSTPTSATEIGADPDEMELIRTLCDEHQGIRDFKILPPVVEKVKAFLEGLGIYPRTDFRPYEDEEYYLHFQSISPSAFFTGRKKELEKMAELVEKNDVVFLSGMGGIGKTELAKKFMEEATGEYRCIFCTYKDSLKSTLAKIKINGIDSEDFKEKEPTLKSLLNRNVLLVIDNFDFDDEEDIDEYIDELCAFGCKKIITTRNTFREYEFECSSAVLTVDTLGDDELKTLFEEKYGEEITESQLRKILEFTGGLTLAIPILASLCVKSGMGVDELCEKISAGLAAFEGTEKLRYTKDRNKRGTVPEIIRLLFKMDNMSEEERKTLCNMSLLRFMEVTRATYKDFAFSDSKGNLDVFNSLVESSWIKEIPGCTPKDSLFELHPLINELVKTDLKPSPETSPEVFGNMDIWFKSMSGAGEIKGTAEEGFLLGLNVTVPENYKYIARLFEKKNIGGEFYPLWRISSSKAVKNLAEELIEELEKREEYTDEDARIVVAILASVGDAIDVLRLEKPIERCFMAEEEGKVETRYILEIINFIETMALFNITGKLWENHIKLYRGLAEKHEKYFNKNCIEAMTSESKKENTAILDMEEKIKNTSSVSAACQMVKNADDICFLEYVSFVVRRFLPENADEKTVLDVLENVLALTDDEKRKKSIYAVFGDIYADKKLTCLSYDKCVELVKSRKERIFIRIAIRAALMCNDASKIKEALGEFLSKREPSGAEDTTAAFIRRSFFHYKLKDESAVEVLCEYVRAMEGRLSKKNGSDVAVLYEWYDLLGKIIEPEILPEEIKAKKEECRKLISVYDIKKKDEE